jgi:hypothetical protein
MRSADSASSGTMDPKQIVEMARSGMRPAGWFVWPLRRERVRRLALQGAAYTLFGLVLFVPTFLATVPSNFQDGATKSILTVIMLSILGALVFYGGWSVVESVLRLARADQYLLVITPSDVVIARPGRIVHVPMRCVAFVTLKGAQIAGNRPVTAGDVMAGDVMAGAGYLGVRRPPPQGRSRGPRSLAFRDVCARRTVLIARDDAFDDLAALHEALLVYAPPDPADPSQAF